MSTASTPRFDTVTLWLHWITAALVLSQFATALSLDHIEPAQIDFVLAVHRSTGLLLWGLTAARLIWRLTLMRVPPADPKLPSLQRLAARANEYALYLLLLVQPVTGLMDSLYRAHAFPVAPEFTNWRSEQHAWRTTTRSTRSRCCRRTG